MPKPKSKRKESAPLGAGSASAAPSPPRTLASPQQIAIQAAVIFALALAIRWVHFLSMQSTLVFEALICDAGQYDAWARRIAAGDWIGSEVFYQTPLYPYLLAVTYSICGHSVWAVRALQAILGGLACVCAARAGARYFSEPVGWIGGILLAVYPPAIFFDGILQKASLDLLLMTALLWVLAAAQDRPRYTLFALAGVLLGAMTLNRENAAVLFPVLSVWFVWLAGRLIKTSRGVSRPWLPNLKQGLQWAGVFAAGAAAVLVPVGLRNYAVGGTFALTTSQMGTNFYIGNHAGANGGYETLRADRGDPKYEALDARLIAEADSKRPLSAGEVSRYWLSRSWAYIESDPTGWLKLMLWKWFLTWNAVEMVDAESIHTHAMHSPLLRGLGWVWHFGVLCPLAALGLWLTRRDWRRLWLLYAMLAAFAAAVTLFYVFARYRYPLVPVAVLFAAAGLWETFVRWRDWQHADRRELWIGLGLAALVAVGCNWTFPQVYDEDAITYYNAGSSLLDVGRLDEARTLLELAAEREPKFSATFNNLGRIAQQHHDLPVARKYFTQAAQIEPKHAVYQVNLATVLMAEGDDSQAIEHLRRAVQLDPLLSPAYRVWAQIEMKHDDPAGAIDHLRRALEIEPNSGATRAELAVALAALGEEQLALQELRTALTLERSVTIGNQLAWLLATASSDSVRNGKQAVELADSICGVTQFKVPELIDTLAAAYAESGQYDKAVETCDKALAVSRDERMTQSLQEKRETYAAKRPWRVVPKKPPSKKPPSK